MCTFWPVSRTFSVCAIGGSVARFIIVVGSRNPVPNNVNCRCGSSILQLWSQHSASDRCTWVLLIPRTVDFQMDPDTVHSTIRSRTLISTAECGRWATDRARRTFLRLGSCSITSRGSGIGFAVQSSPVRYGNNGEGASHQRH